VTVRGIRIERRPTKRGHRRWWVYLGRWWVSIGLGPRPRSFLWGAEFKRSLGVSHGPPSSFVVSGGPLIVSGLRRDYA
jgi:hypothetical protein